MLKLLTKGFWPNFALRYAHSTAGEISGLFACKLQEGIWLSRQHFPSGHRVHAHQLFRPTLWTTWPQGSQIPRPPRITYQNTHGAELLRKHTSALEEEVEHLLGMLAWELAAGLLSPGRFCGYNPAELPEGI